MRIKPTIERADDQQIEYSRWRNFRSRYSLVDTVRSFPVVIYESNYVYVWLESDTRKFKGLLVIVSTTF